MLRAAADENFNNDILRGVLRRNPGLDFVRIQDSEVAGADDPTVLEWTAHEGRVLFTHDVSTMTAYAMERILARKSMPGIFQIGRDVSIAEAIETILVLAECSLPGEWEGQIRYFPL